MTQLNGIGASPGIAIGRALKYERASGVVLESCFPAQEEAAQLARLARARAEAKAELAAIIEEMSANKPEQAKVFSAHIDILEDDDINDEIETLTRAEHRMPEWAAKSIYDKYRALLSESGNELIAQRAADIDDVCVRLLRRLSGETQSVNIAALESPAVVVADDLLPSDTAVMDKTRVLGIVTQTGGATSHSAIIARAYGIPAVLGVKDALKRIEHAQQLVVDGEGGLVLLSPDAATQKAYGAKRDRLERETAQAREYLRRPCVLSNGERVEIGINIANDKTSAGFEACDFVGLFRSEFLYMDSERMPSEDEQYEAYCAVLKKAAGKPVTLRTLDIGGDKTLPYLPLPREANPFLGKRAVRLCFEHPELFMTQLRAALRASSEGRLQIMFPMIGGIEDIRRAKAFVKDAMSELDATGRAYDKNIKIGIMIEIPSIALAAELAAAEVDFASIGTNDLCQYVCAADRMEPGVSEYYRELSPAFLRLLANVIGSFNEAKKEISICGELAGNTRATPLLLGMGLRKFSVSPPLIPQVKKRVSETGLERSRDILKRALTAATQRDVVDILFAAEK